MYICGMESAELIKGTLTPIILKLLEENGKMYGYEITQKVKEITGGKILVKEGSLYPALHKLLKDGLVEVETVEIGNRPRKYYSLTPSGHEQKNRRFDELKEFVEIMQQVIAGRIQPQV